MCCRVQAVIVVHTDAVLSPKEKKSSYDFNIGDTVQVQRI